MNLKPIPRTLNVTLHRVTERDHVTVHVDFSTEADLDTDQLELSLCRLQGCNSLLSLEYDVLTGNGCFSLMNKPPELSVYTVCYPLLPIVRLHASLTFGMVTEEETLTHIAGDRIGVFQTLCGTETVSQQVNSLCPVDEVRVTCERCQAIWQRCQLFTAQDFATKQEENA
ncbi:hypothetical protein [Xenorhabdus bovienii]|uniref:Uncharacterized protein n=1 Tax=Xenorhabdus bovienii str. feltiae Moldova TaxID=1398200 RepID=A0A077NPU9_XENBV|nr:hypothetical protein [Xenorhabdus bovienii]CDH00564.1 hypothetical protein XBFM1_1710032 [Xenorhabdus bovienii str. feltiae Moldova]